jgi:hypothetical protein
MRRPQLPDPHTKDAPEAAPYVLAGAAYACGWFILAWPWLSGRVTIPWDAKAHFLPQIQFMAASFARGESPFWNPFVFAGHPQIADPQSMLFSPPFLLLAAFNAAPSAWAVDTTVYVCILAAGLALIAWFYDRSWHPGGALVAALSFGFGAAMAWRIQHTGQVLSLAYLPITLLLLDRALTRASVGYGLLAGIVAAALVLGRDQVALLAVYFLIAYVVWRFASAPSPRTAILGASRPLIAAGLIGTALIAIPITLTAQLAELSNRPEIDFIGAGRGSLHPALGLTAVVPDLFGSSGRMWDYWGPPSFAWQGTDLFLAQNMGQLYIGAIPALLILFGLGSGVLIRREIVFFTAALGVTTLYALGWFTPFFKLTHTFLPGISLYRRPADTVFLIGFLGAVLAGYSLHTLLQASLTPRSIQRGILAAAVVTVAAFATAIGLAVRMDHLAAARGALILSGGLFLVAATVLTDAAWIAPIRPIAASALIAAFTVGDLAISNGPGSATALPPATYDVLNPATTNETIAILKRKTLETRSDTRRDRVELAGLGFHWPNASMTHRLDNTLGYNPVRLGLYTQATGAGDNVGLPDERKFSPLFPSYKSRLADLLGLRYIATSLPLVKLDPAVRPGDFPLLAMTSDGYIYENPRALPRVIFANASLAADFDLILNTGTWPEADLSSTVLLTPDDRAAIGLVPEHGPGTARILTATNTETTIEVDSTRGGFVVLNDVWHPSWTVDVDGEPKPLLKANVLFRAVRVPKGRHTVRFTFAPLAGAWKALVAR